MDTSRFLTSIESGGETNTTSGNEICLSCTSTTNTISKCCKKCICSNCYAEWITRKRECMYCHVDQMDLEEWKTNFRIDTSSISDNIIQFVINEDVFIEEDDVEEYEYNSFNDSPSFEENVSDAYVEDYYNDIQNHSAEAFMQGIIDILMAQTVVNPLVMNYLFSNANGTLSGNIISGNANYFV